MEKYNTIYFDNFRHQFLYAKKGECRTKWLKDMAVTHPIVPIPGASNTRDDSGAVYVNDFDVPDISSRNSYDKLTILRLYNDFLAFSIFLEIVKKIIDDNATKDVDVNKLLEPFIVNITLVGGDRNLKITTVGELVAALEASKEYCRLELKKRNKNENYEINMDGLPLNIVDFNTHMSTLLKCLYGNNFRYAPNLMLLLDFTNEGDIPFGLMMAVNGLISSDTMYSVKPAVEADEWKTHYALNGGYIQYTHDYTDCDLDGSYKQSIDAKKKSYGF